jgi:hypothetical protein
MNEQWLAQPFPMPSGPELRGAYNDLYLAANGDETTKKRLGNPKDLPRPWDPPTCTSQELRVELWDWLDAVAVWFNHEYVWDLSAGGFIPACWPLHPPLVHEIAVLADQRRRASLDTTSTSLDEWHRYSVPAFVDRLKNRTKTLCDEDHKAWPARSRFGRFLGVGATQARRQEFDADAAELFSVPRQDEQQRGLRLITSDGQAVDPETGEVFSE